MNDKLIALRRMFSNGKKQTANEIRNFESRNVEYGNVSAQRENNPVDTRLINIAIEICSNKGNVRWMKQSSIFSCMSEKL